MAAKLSSTDVLGKMDAKMLAMLLQSMGRGNDTILAHITPREAKKLKREGGRGSRNPETGLLEFDDEFFADFYAGNQTPTFDVPSYGGETGAFQPTGGDFPVQGAYAEPVTGGYTPEPVSGYTPQADIVGGGYGEGGLVSGPTAGTGLPQPTDLGPVAAQYNNFQTTPEFQKVLDYYGGEAGTTPEAYAPPEAGAKEGLFGKLTAGDILKGALGAGTGLMGYLQQQRAQEQAKKAAGQLQGAYTGASEQVKQLAAPYFSVGGTQLAQALQGRLDPARLRQLEITRAKLAQSAARTGGVGAIQAATAMERAYQDALTAQQEAAFKLLGPGNDLAYKALMAQLQGQTGSLNMQLQLTQQAQQAASNLYSQIGRYVAGV